MCAAPPLLNFMFLFYLVPGFFFFTRHYRALRSASATMRLAVPRTRLACAGRCFSVSAPALWNALPPHLHHCSTLRTFKTNLKTHLFRQRFG